MELRKSSCTISAELENEEDKYMLVHGYTGAIDIAGGKCDQLSGFCELLY
jgi:hypothetical protein